MGSENKNGKVPLISKIAYGFGDVGYNFSWMFVSNFLMIFYTDVFGISMAAVSALMLFSRFWDAILLISGTFPFLFSLPICPSYFYQSF